jgi:Flp pilus assembly secretin CpaC
MSKEAMAFGMWSHIAALALALIVSNGQSVFGAGKLVTSPTEQGTQPVVSRPIFEDIRPSGPPIVLGGLSSGTLLHLPDAANNVFIADDEVANVQIQSQQPQYIYVTAKKPGRTVLYVVNSAGDVLLNKAIEVFPRPVTIIRRAKVDTGEAPPPPNFLVLPLQPASTTPMEAP